MLYVDIPTAAEIAALCAHRGELCVSLYLPTSPVTRQAGGDRIAFKNQVKEALRQLDEAGTDKRRSAAIAEHLAELGDDDEFWRFQAHSLVVFASPNNLRSFRVPNALQPVVEVADRFYVKPLLRAVSFANACYVLALSQRAVRVLEVSPDLPTAEVKLDGMPRDAGRASRNDIGADRRPLDRQPRSVEAEKTFLRQYCRQIDKALRPILTGSDIPLVLAASEPIASIYRSVNNYAHLAEGEIGGNPETLSGAGLAERARPVLDGVYRRQLAEWRDRFELRENQGRATTDIAQAARAATMGAVDSMLADIDETMPGTIDEEGAVTFAEAADATNYGLVDEIASRVIATGGRVIGVRRPDIPHDQPLAAILRHPV